MVSWVSCKLKRDNASIVCVEIGRSELVDSAAFINRAPYLDLNSLKTALQMRMRMKKMTNDTYCILSLDAKSS